MLSAIELLQFAIRDRLVLFTLHEVFGEDSLEVNIVIFTIVLDRGLTLWQQDRQTRLLISWILPPLHKLQILVGFFEAWVRDIYR